MQERTSISTLIALMEADKRSTDAATRAIRICIKGQGVSTALVNEYWHQWDLTYLLLSQTRVLHRGVAVGEAKCVGGQGGATLKLRLEGRSP